MSSHRPNLDLYNVFGTFVIGGVRWIIVQGWALSRELLTMDARGRSVPEEDRSVTTILNALRVLSWDNQFRGSRTAVTSAEGSGLKKGSINGV